MISTVFDNTRACGRASSVLCATILTFAGVITASAQAPMAPMGRPDPANAGGQNKQLTDQIAEMRAEIARLQAAVDQKGMGGQSKSKPPMAMGSGKGMSMMEGEMGGMKQMKDDMAEMGAMKPMKPMKDDMDEMGSMPASGGTKAPAKAMGMCCMGMMGMAPSGSAGMSGMGASAPAAPMAGMSGPSSAMPGQPGASHILHIGSTGFFLNHGQHITLTPDQKSKLNRLKEKAMLEQSSSQRQIDQAEQEVYALTGAEQVDNAKVQAKISETEKLRSTQRMSFIQAVSEASNVLTHDQHRALMGTMSAGTK